VAYLLDPLRPAATSPLKSSENLLTEKMTKLHSTVTIGEENWVNLISSEAVVVSFENFQGRPDAKAPY